MLFRSVSQSRYLQQKVYNMLNRIAVSGGTYRDWLETVYTAGKYLDRPETPVFIGGMTQYIEFVYFFH